MPRQTWMPAAARHFGLNVVEMDGCMTRGAESFNPGGTTCHHIAGSSSGEAPALGLIFFTGRPDLPPPLANWVLGRPVNGVVRCFFGAAGRANHAGRGGFNGLAGNSSVIGIEPENDGRQPWPIEQQEAYWRLVAAMQWGMRRGAEWAHGHKEWAPGRKPDPHTLNMNEFRGHVATILNNPTPEDDMTPEQHALLVDTNSKTVEMWHAFVQQASAPVVKYDGNGKRMVFVQGIDRSIYVKAEGNDQWVDLGGKSREPITQDQIAVAPDGRVTIVVKGDDDAAWLNERNVGGTWSGWKTLGGLID